MADKLPEKVRAEVADVIALLVRDKIAMDIAFERVARLAAQECVEICFRQFAGHYETSQQKRGGSKCITAISDAFGLEE